MRPRGFSSATRLAGRSWRTIWQKTFCSRTRRAISCPYCEPKSKIRMRSLSGCGGIWLHCCIGWGFIVCPQSKQLLQYRFIVDVAVAPIAFDFDLTIFKELDFPVLTRSESDHHDCVITGMAHLIRDLGLVQPLQEGQQPAKLVLFHLSNLFSFSSLWKVLKPGFRRQCPSTTSSQVRCMISANRANLYPDELS